MKKIVGYRKLLGVSEGAELQELKTVYRNLMKEWHPDKFPENPELAEAKSRHIIEAYHFLVSIAPETRAQTFAEFTLTTTTAALWISITTMKRCRSILRTAIATNGLVYPRHCT